MWVSQGTSRCVHSGWFGWRVSGASVSSAVHKRFSPSCFVGSGTGGSGRSGFGTEDFFWCGTHSNFPQHGVRKFGVHQHILLDSYCFIGRALVERDTITTAPRTTNIVISFYPSYFFHWLVTFRAHHILFYKFKLFSTGAVFYS